MERGGTANGSGALIGSSGSGERKRGEKESGQRQDTGKETQAAAASPTEARPPG